jgi:hypothetical protein
LVSRAILTHVANVPTDRRAVVRVLLRRGVPYGGAPATRRVGGYHVMVVGEAKGDEWPSFEVGDLEGVVWTTPRQVRQVVENLRTCEGVVDAKGTPSDWP